MAVLSDSQDDSQHGGRLGILAVGSGILTPSFELRRTSMDGGVHRSCGLQKLFAGRCWGVLGGFDSHPSPPSPVVV